MNESQMLRSEIKPAGRADAVSTNSQRDVATARGEHVKEGGTYCSNLW